MSSFQLYVKLGFEHITDWQGMDHMLFLLALTTVYQFRHWLRVLAAVTAFTLGHTLTLILAAAGVVNIDSEIIEFLIPLTILITGIINLLAGGRNPRSNSRIFMAGLFGLIHGLGFFGFYRMMTLGEGEGWPSLLPFALGVELGQLLIVFVILIVTAILYNLMGVKSRDWNLFSSGLVCGVAAYLMIQNFPW